MSELGRIAADIRKGKYLDINLPKYMNMMVSAYHRYAHIHLALNYYTWGSMLTAERNAPESMLALAKRLNAVIREQLLGSFRPEKLEQGLEEIDAIRTEIMKNMQTLTCYTDCFQIYEYVLNRLEYRFNDAEFPAGYEDEDFVEEILSYIQRDRDNAVIHMRINEVVGQLPLRMTRQRYFEIVKESLSLYLGSEKSNLEDTLYMLRTCAALSEPQETEGDWEELAAIYTGLKGLDTGAVTEEDMKRLTLQLQLASEQIDRRSNLYMIMQEIVNDVYILLLSLPYALTDTGETESCRRILLYVLEQMEKGHSEAFEEEEELDGVLEHFEKLEGRQERLYEQFSQNDYILDSMEEMEGTLESLMLDKLYLGLKQIMKLASTSIFIELHEKRDTEPVDEAYLEQVTLQFIGDMEQAFQGQTKLINRARMAITLEALPAFFRNMDECREYIRQALMNCYDEREKLASVELIREIMEP